MTIHFMREIDKLKRNILSLSQDVQKTLVDALMALEKGDIKLAKKIIKDDEKINSKEVEVEEECLKILALHQPVASDLRFIIAVLKINSELERIGDLAANIAERAIALGKYSDVSFDFDFKTMHVIVKKMLNDSLDGLVNLNAKIEKEVCAADDKIDIMHESVYEIVAKATMRNPQSSSMYLEFLSISRYLERIADSITNIAEDVIYLVTGEIPRHRF